MKSERSSITSLRTGRGTSAALAILAALAIANLAANAQSAWESAVAQARARQQPLLPAEDAAGAVDGVIDGSFSFHTSQDEAPFWQVDLGAPEPISAVIVYNSAHMPARAANLRVLLSADGASWSEVYAHDGTPFVGADGSPLKVPLSNQLARHVRIQLPGPTWLHLDEVQVLSAGGETNLALRKPATQSSTSQWSTRSIKIEQQHSPADAESLVHGIFTPLLKGAGAAGTPIRDEIQTLLARQVDLDDGKWAALHSRAANARQQAGSISDGLARFNPRALRMAIEDMAASFPGRFPEARAQLAQLAQIESGLENLRRRFSNGSIGAWEEAERVLAFQRGVLLANPLLDFDNLLVVRRNLGNRARSAMSSEIGLASNFHANDAVASFGWDNEIARLSSLRAEPQAQTLFRPEGGRIVTDVTLEYDARRLMFASPGKAERAWRIFEIDTDGSNLAQVTPDEGEDISHSDPCYLPDGRVIFASTASFVGLPCVYGAAPMVCLYRLDRRTGEIRQLTFEQDSDWCPTVTQSGRVLYLRWEYADLPHSNSRILFHMNPDGTGQIEYYGSGSYFPPSFFYARPVPDHPTMIAGIVTGHHGTHRSGRLLLLDPARGRYEATGVVQEIPGWGKQVEPVVADRIVDGVWPHFLHPYPLSDKYFLVAMKEHPNALWGIYLADIFDNLTLIKETEGAALLQPIPLAARMRPPVIADKTDLSRNDAVVMIGDVHQGPGLAGIPRGEVKQLRVISYYWSSRGMGGLLGSIGMDGPWDIKRVLGTVPVEPDGSANFRIPANKPLTLQPLDSEGKALQLKRTWIVGMPGEVVSCAGCHDSQNAAPPVQPALAAMRPPSIIEPWYGPPRGFAFHREVQPVLDRHCVGCHDGQTRPDGARPIDLRGTGKIADWSSQIAGNVGYTLPHGGQFSVAYANLHRYVRRPGIESDLRMLTPGEFHADTTELVQTLRDRRHKDLELNREDWDRLITWIDLNTPYHGTWSELAGREAVNAIMPRRHELSKRHAGIFVDYEAIHDVQYQRGQLASEASNSGHSRPRPSIGTASTDAAPEAISVSIPGWPFDAIEAGRRQGSPDAARRTIDLGDGVELELIYIPAGHFVMGQPGGTGLEALPAAATVEKPFWMSRFEIKNSQFNRFDPDHDSRHESRHGYQFGRKGYPVNDPDHPVVRVSWNRAMDFCRWLSSQGDLLFTLPTETQWEWAARAGTATPFFFGGMDADYSAYANLGDIRLSEYAACTARGDYTKAEILVNPGRHDDWVPRDNKFNDGHFLSAPAGSYRPNGWGLADMVGNVWEWTRSEADGGAGASRRMIVRGGSWRDRPHRATLSSRLDYRPYHQVFNVGFRVVAQPAAL
jgi:formylglycine-generating enzyme required for sulfatase activity